MNAAAPDAWARGIARQIERDLRSAWGAGLDNLTPAHREALIAVRILAILTGQAQDHFAPAIELVGRIQRATEHLHGNV